MKMIKLLSSVEICLQEMNEEDCPVILHGNDTLSLHYHYHKRVSDGPLDEGQIYEFRECRYEAKRSWSNEPLRALYPDGKVDTLYIERKSKFTYLPFGFFVENFSNLE